MKKFFRFLGAAAAVFTGIVAAFAVLGRLFGRKSSKGYLDISDNSPEQ